MNSVRFSGVGNAAGSFTGLSGAPPVGGTMGLSAMAKICLSFDASCSFVSIPIALTPTPGGAGFGIGGTAVATGPVSVTLQHAPWTLGQPVMTIHNAGTNVTTPALPGGFAHGAASATSSTAAARGVLQLVTATKAYTSLTGAFPEMPVTGVLSIELVRDACDDDFDYDGGLSALGYIAADPDPQCGDNPWKDKEKSGPCGLGFELALILPGLMWLHRRRRRLH